MCRNPRKSKEKIDTSGDNFFLSNGTMYKPGVLHEKGLHICGGERDEENQGSGRTKTIADVIDCTGKRDWDDLGVVKLRHEQTVLLQAD